MVEHALDHDMAALDQAQVAGALLRRGHVQHLRRPRPGGVDHVTGVDADAAAGGLVDDRFPAGALAGERVHARLGEDGGALLAGVHGVEYHQAGVVHPAVRVRKAAAELGLERLAGRVAAQVDGGGTRQQLAPGQGVVQPQAGADQQRRALAFRMRHDEAQRPHDVRRGTEQYFALDQRLAHQVEFVVLEIAQAAVDQLGRGRRRVRRQVVLFAQDDRQPASGRIARDPRAIDAASHDQDIAIERVLRFRHEFPEIVTCNIARFTTPPTVRQISL